MFHLILNDPALAKTDKSSVRFIGVGSAPASPALFEALHRAFPNAAASNGYGVTEAGPVMFANHPEGKPRPATSIGYPLAGCEIRLDPGPDEGVLLTRNPGVMAAYHNLPEETARRLKDGWFDTERRLPARRRRLLLLRRPHRRHVRVRRRERLPGRRRGHAGAPPGRAAGRGAAGGSRAEGPGAGGLRGRAARLGPQRAGREGVGAGPRPRVPASPTRVPRPRAAPGRDEQDRSRGAQGARAGCPTRPHEEIEPCSSIAGRS